MLHHIVSFTDSFIGDTLNPILTGLVEHEKVEGKAMKVFSRVITVA